MTVFITGINSFVGKRLTEKLDDLLITYHGIDISGSTSKKIKRINLNSNDLIKSIENNTTSVVHLAAISREQDCVNNEVKCFDVNISGTINLMDAVIRKNIGKVIFASTEWVYDEEKSINAIDEEHLIDTNKISSSYGLSKFLGENLIRNICEKKNICYQILRFGIIYGARKNNWSAVENLFFSVMKSNEIKIGSKKTARCFVHVDDICDAIIQSLEQKESNIFNVQFHKPITLEEIINTSCSILKKKVLIKEDKSKIPSIRNISSKKIKAMTNWTPKFDLLKGLNSLNKYFNKKNDSS